MCKDSNCRLYPDPSTNMYFAQKAMIENKNMGKPRTFLPRMSDSEFKIAIGQMNAHFQRNLKWETDLKPKVDPDHDYFSTEFAYRGFAWRGKDCNSDDPKVYPGRKNGTSSKLGEDYNCNGIKGIDTKTGKAWKDVLCPAEHTGNGIAVIGDSVGARFRLPEFYLTSSNISWELISMLPELLEFVVSVFHFLCNFFKTD